MRVVDVRTETQAPAGWSYEVAVRRDGQESAHVVTLSWADHDFWCGGTLAPSRVVQAVVEYLLDYAPITLPARFDAAKARRWAPRIDDEIRTPQG
ncbi:MAG: hypothetical protein HUU18_02870 [Phycisphaerales bacterium]|nr:hypothetical protein [Phycisphaerales bacterium]